jgi:hypothetical protein
MFHEFEIVPSSETSGAIGSFPGEESRQSLAVAEAFDDSAYEVCFAGVSIALNEYIV